MGCGRRAGAGNPLGTLGLIHVALALAAVGAVGWLWRRIRKGGLVRGLTWDCGYAAPTARMQYTAGSFAGIITEWFAWILRPVRHADRPEEIFPRSGPVEEHTPETVLERVIEPIGGWCCGYPAWSGGCRMVGPKPTFI
jgi:hydrogenase-4 component B